MIYFLAAAAAAASSPGAEIVIGGIASAKGSVNIAICTEKEFLGTCAITKRIPARRGSVSTRIAVPRAGRYAVMAFHDENGNGKLDRNELGIPVEGYGFSRDATGRQGPPTFASAALPFSAGITRVVFDMRY